jgi:hypothetical protein
MERKPTPERVPTIWQYRIQVVQNTILVHEFSARRRGHLEVRPCQARLEATLEDPVTVRFADGSRWFLS